MTVQPRGGSPAAAVQSVDRWSLLAACSAIIADEPEDPRVERLVAEQAASLAQAGDARLELLDYDRSWLVLRQAVGPHESQVGRRQAPDVGVAGEVVQSGESFCTDALGDHPLGAAEPDAATWSRVLAVPLRSKRELLGVLRVSRASTEPPFSEVDAAALQVLADLAATRLGASHRTAALRARAQELAVLDPVWRLPPEQAGDFVLVVKNRRELVDADDAACRYLDYSREALLQRSLGDLIFFPPWAEHTDTLGNVREQMLRGLTVTFDSSIRRRDGSVLPVRMQLQAFPAPDGFITRTVFRDLSVEKRAQTAAVQAEKMRVLQEVGSGLAHEINTPLAVVLGNVEMLLDECTDAEQRVLLTPVQHAAQRISDTVKTMQRFARPVTPSAMAMVDLSVIAWEVVEQTRPLWEVAPREENRPITLRLDNAAVPEVRGHPVELREALRELLVNAVQALPEGGTIVVRTEAKDGQVVLSVADDGVGMSDEVRQLCTEPFYTTRRPAAVGLGLNRVYHAALRHRGQLQVESTQGHGTTVTLSLPAYIPEDGRTV